MIQRFLSKKSNLVILAVIAVFALSIAAYITISVYKNVQLMSAMPEAVTYFPEYPKVTATPDKTSLVARGEYLTKAGDCIACHTNTAKKGPAFAGGLAMPTPFGTIYTPNITPDKETGIGNWTEDQFIKAMREGISPQGHYYYPAFPYIYFNKVTTEDLKAIKAYLDSIPAVNQPNRENEMVFPFNFRILQLPWRLMFFHSEGTYKPDTQLSPAEQRGGYFVEGLGHCAMCHTPSYQILSDKLPLGAPIHKYALTGAKIQGYLAPNISSSNLKNTPLTEIVAVFKEDKMIGGGKIEGPMLEVNRDSLSYLTAQDLEAISAYLKTVKSELPPKKGSGGAGVYDSYCSGCHSTGAGGAPKYGDPSSWTPILKNDIQVIYNNAIKGINGMPAKGTCLSCSDDEIKQAVDYMVASVAGKKGKTAAPKPKRLTMEDSKRVYEANCSICHASGYKNAIKPGDVNAWKPVVKEGFVEAYLDVVTGRKGHPLRGACPKCSDAEIIAALKYMMQQSAPGKDFSLW